MKKILLILLSISILYGEKTLQERFPDLSKETISYFEKQITMIETSIDEDYKNFDALSEKERLQFKENTINLISDRMFFKNITKDKKGVQFISLYKFLVNYKAYILIDKFSDDEVALKTALLYSSVLNELYPDNISYKDTYLWGYVKSGKYTYPLKMYPKLVKKSNSKEIQKHYEYVLSKTKDMPVIALKDATLATLEKMGLKQSVKKIHLGHLQKIKAPSDKEFMDNLYNYYRDNNISFEYRLGIYDSEPQKDTLQENLKQKEQLLITYKTHNGVKTASIHVESINKNIAMNFYSKMQELEVKIITKEIDKIVIDLSVCGGGLFSQTLRLALPFFKDAKNNENLLFVNDTYYLKKNAGMTTYHKNDLSNRWSKDDAKLKVGYKIISPKNTTIKVSEETSGGGEIFAGLLQQKLGYRVVSEDKNTKQYQIMKRAVPLYLQEYKENRYALILPVGIYYIDEERKDLVEQKEIRKER